MATVPVRDLTGPAGHLEALLDVPDQEGPVRAAVVLAHPDPQQGGTFNTKVVHVAAESLAGIGCAVLRFNFRGVGASAGSWSEGIGERDDFRAALDWMSARYPESELWAAGFSFGAWLALTEGAADPRVSLLIGIAPAIGLYDFSAVVASAKPKFLVHGERDELTPLKSMYELYGRLQEPKELSVVDAADHLFDGHVSEVGDALEDLLGDYRTPTN